MVSSGLQDGATLLHAASQEGHVGVVQALLAAGADKDAVNEKKVRGCLPFVSQAAHSWEVMLWFKRYQRGREPQPAS